MRTKHRFLPDRYATVVSLKPVTPPASGLRQQHRKRWVNGSPGEHFAAFGGGRTSRTIPWREPAVGAVTARAGDDLGPTGSGAPHQLPDPGGPDPLPTEAFQLLEQLGPLPERRDRHHVAGAGLLQQ